MTESEISKVTKQWDDFGLLKPFRNATKTVVAMCLEKQRRLNETNYNAHWNRISIPVLVRMFRQIGVFGKSHINEYFDDREVQAHVLRARFEPPQDAGIKNLDNEVNYCAELSKRIAGELVEFFDGKTHDGVIFHGLVLLPGKKIAFLYN